MLSQPGLPGEMSEAERACGAWCLRERLNGGVWGIGVGIVFVQVRTLWTVGGGKGGYTKDDSPRKKFANRSYTCGDKRQVVTFS